MPIAQSFQFFPSDYQGDPHTIVMTTEENGAYCLLMWVCWELEGLPNDIEELAGYARLPVKRFQSMWEKRIRRCFVYDEKRDQFLHPRFEKIIREIKAFRKQRSEAGKASSRKRQKLKGLGGEHVLNSVDVSLVREGNEIQPASSFSSSTSISKEKKEEEAQSQAIGPGRPKRDERLDHPAIKAAHAVTGKFPPRDLWDAIIEIVEEQPNEVLMKKCWVAWRGKGFSPMNFAWLFEWYSRGGPQEGNYGSNSRYNSQNKPTAAERIAGREYYRADAGPETGDRRSA
jgi:uncharacterized protein YdaU (DUF1376 family)